MVSRRDTLELREVSHPPGSVALPSTHPPPCFPIQALGSHFIVSVIHVHSLPLQLAIVLVDCHKSLLRCVCVSECGFLIGWLVGWVCCFVFWQNFSHFYGSKVYISIKKCFPSLLLPSSCFSVLPAFMSFSVLFLFCVLIFAHEPCHY